MFGCQSNICRAMGKDVLPIHTMQHWFHRFKNGNFELDDFPHTGRLLEVDTGCLKAAYPRQSQIDGVVFSKVFSTPFNHLGKKTFDDAKDLKMDLLNFCHQKSQHFYECGIFSLPERWRQVIARNGAYIFES